LNKEKRRQLTEWILTYLPEKNDLQGTLELQGLAGDAGFRRYYRLNTIPSMIAVDSPPSKENNLAYVQISLALNARGIRRPHLYAVDFSRGFLLLEDLGEQLMQPLLNDETVDKLYGQAELMLLSIQNSAPDTQIFPIYEKASLAQEFDLFAAWFVKKLLGISIDKHAKNMLDTLCTDLITSALSQPQVIVHRDYHSRNLMVVDDKKLAVIDFQDAVIGPVTYDLVSLLKDCYVTWPRELVESRVLSYRKRLEDSQLMAGVDEQTFLRWFDLMGLHRHIKVMGIFARLALRDGKTGYLHDLPLVIAYVLDVVARYPEAAAFGQWFETKITPHLRSHSWYSDNHQFSSADLTNRDKF
jgi:aminoglycoside/choline kinase family phosphotransferase|tara:strand:- start:4366 stop:5433 length:1068 start_codon:yes stop_codon:yes gene_type:complete